MKKKPEKFELYRFTESSLEIFMNHLKHHYFNEFKQEQYKLMINVCVFNVIDFPFDALKTKPKRTIFLMKIKDVCDHLFFSIIIYCI